MDEQFALKMESPTNTAVEASSDNGGIVVNGVKVPPNNKCNRYYYRNREQILEKRLLKKLENPEYKAKYEEKQKKKAEQEAKRAELEVRKAEFEAKQIELEKRKQLLKIEKERQKSEKLRLKEEKIRLKSEILLNKV
jgi:hypothetical protein